MSAPRQKTSTRSKSTTFGERIERFLTSLTLPITLPSGISVLDPYRDPVVQQIVHEFCQRFYASDSPRVAVWGINPGRFGAGVTGLSFTDPAALRTLYGIETSLQGRRELSAEFIERMIVAYGGPQSYYHDVYMSAISPLGFVKDGININFYDDPALKRAIIPFALESIAAAHEAGVRSDVCVVLGTGSLKAFVEREIRPVIGWKQVAYLEHPRYIMQYRRKEVPAFVEKYCGTIRDLVSCANS
jgi:hypothetical protein